jgi:prevent-host-death family protein
LTNIRRHVTLLANVGVTNSKEEKEDMDHGGAYEAHSDLQALLDRVSHGEQVTITRQGVPVAILQPYPVQENEKVKKVIAELRTLRPYQQLGDVSIQELITKRERA